MSTMMKEKVNGTIKCNQSSMDYVIVKYTPRKKSYIEEMQMSINERKEPPQSREKI
jgi:hypothetical protein